METNRDNDSSESPVSPRLIAALRQSQKRRVFVPPTVDKAVLRTAREHLSPVKQRSSSPLPRWFRWLAFATACLLLCAAYWLTRQSSSWNRGPTYAREDLNRDGRVDILDAFQLARELQSGTKPVTAHDMNSDGDVDRRDVEIIAAQAVKLERGGRS